MPAAKKRRKPKAAGPAGSSRPSAKPGPVDFRDIESLLAALSSGFGEEPEDDALAEAQDLMWTAWDTSDRRRRVAMAKRALKVSPLCADAFVLLAQETAQTPAEAIELYRHGVSAGEQALGPRAFKEDVGDFWEILETRPYMRARNGLAQALWEAGETDEAIGHYRELLRLNPNDNQGNRYLLAECLLKLGRDDELAALLGCYDEDWSADFGYTAALIAFRREGDGPKSRARLRVAVKINKHVPDYLLGVKKVPRGQPQYLTMGGEDEAQDYVRRCGDCWKRNTAALEWLAAKVTGAPARRSKRGGAGSP